MASFSMLFQSSLCLLLRAALSAFDSLLVSDERMQDALDAVSFDIFRFLSLEPLSKSDDWLLRAALVALLRCVECFVAVLIGCYALP